MDKGVHGKSGPVHPRETLVFTGENVSKLFECAPQVRFGVGLLYAMMQVDLNLAESLPLQLG